jgi:signal transduction histidine kinase
MNLREGREPEETKPGLSGADFLHQTRHDIRSAMHVVTGMSKVLALSEDLPPSQKEIAAIMKRNADRALELIDRMFDFIENEEKRLK